MRASMMCSTLLVLAGALAPLRAQSGGVRVIVNAANPATAVTRQLAEQLFLKQRTRWSDNSAVVVVDQVEKAGTRRQFSQQVLKRDVSAVKSYWKQMTFSGRAVAPPEVAGDAEVMALVRSNPGAVGYVSADVALGPGVKELTVSGT